MAHPTGESKDELLKLDFDRRLMLQFRGSVVTSDAGLLAYRELDDALGLSAMAGEMLADARTGKNGRHDLSGLFRQSVFGRLACQQKWPDQPARPPFGVPGLRQSSAPPGGLVRTPQQRKNSPQFGVHLGNPGSKPEWPWLGSDSKQLVNRRNPCRRRSR
jgi:hypothetical protein